MKGPWTFLLLAAGIVLLAGDGYFPGEDAVGILAILAGLCRFALQCLAAVTMATINAAVKSGKIKSVDGKWLPPKAPR